MNKFMKSEWPLLLILLLAFLTAIVVFPFMPERVPTHWNAAGEIDGYSGRAFGTFFLPFMNLGLYVLFLVIPKLDPKKANYEKFAGSYRLIRWIMHLFMLGIFALTIAASLGYQMDVGLWVASGTAILFIVIGNILGRVRHNYFVGIRLPWTLASEAVWKKTHQFASKAMVMGGLGGLAGVILTQGSVRFAFLMIGIFLPLLVTVVYSYMTYRELEGKK